MFTKSYGSRLLRHEKNFIIKTASSKAETGAGLDRGLRRIRGAQGILGEIQENRWQEGM